MMFVTVRPSRFLIAAVVFGFTGAWLLAEADRLHSARLFLAGAAFALGALLLGFVGLRWLYRILRILFS